nr:MAG TPA: hypothetical protein [Caudoviricetes sp.]
MSEITVTTQQQFDNLPRDYHGRIYIKFGTPYDRAIVRWRYDFASVVARENSSVEAWENSSVEAWGNSSVEAFGNSSVEAFGNSSVVAFGNSSVVAHGNSAVEARGNSYVEAFGNSSVVARENSAVEAFENSSVVAQGNSAVEARENSSVETWGNSSVEACGNSQINQKSIVSKIKVSGNARIVCDPCSIDEYVNFYGIENSNGKAKLFKAVRKRDGLYRSGWDSDFVYTIGKSAVADGFCTDPNEDCGNGIHMAYLSWCLEYGSYWHDLAILEVEVDMSTVVVPKYSSGKVRAPSCKVIREVPLEECGLYGKILARRYGG